MTKRMAAAAATTAWKVVVVRTRVAALAAAVCFEPNLCEEVMKTPVAVAAAVAAVWEAVKTVWVVVLMAVAANRLWWVRRVG